MAKRNNRAPWIVVLMVLITVILYFQIPEKSNQPPQGSQEPGSRYNLEKTGAGAIADFTASSRKIHNAVDGVISKAGLKVQDIKEFNKEIPRQQVEGTIRWHTRQIMINVPANTTGENIKQLVSSGVAGTGGEIVEAQPDNYQGLQVERLDIGLRDNLGGDEIKIITDRLYLYYEGANASKSKPGSAAKATMALVIDDFGYSYEPIAAFAGINRPITFAVIPYRPHSNEAAARGVSSGHQVILHLPLEPLAAASQSEPITIGVAMSDAEIRETASKAIQSVPGIIGVNNHQGSRATADRRVMRQVLSVIKSNNLFFLDSRTNSQSVGVEVAGQIGVRSAANDIFLDNENEVTAVKRQIRTACDMALRDGSVIAIGHARMTTAEAVQSMIPEIENKGIKLVFVSEMVR